jgi:hypothetical protein
MRGEELDGEEQQNRDGVAEPPDEIEGIIEV